MNIEYICFININGKKKYIFKNFGINGKCYLWFKNIYGK